MNDRDSNVVAWPHLTVAPIMAEKVLSGAIERGVEPLIAVGYDRDGRLYVASTHSQTAEIMALLRLAQRYIEDDCMAQVAPR